MRFERRKVLGRGAAGVVWRAFDPELGREVAVKTLDGVPGELTQRLKAEFRVLRGVSHPNLVQLYDLVIADHERCFSMELIEGVELVRYVRGTAGPRASLDTDGLVRLRSALGQLIGALEALHAARKVHRDLKPSNVLVTRAGRVVVLDLGLVTPVGGGATGEFSGTGPYMAPEQMWGVRPAPAIDWYAVGVLVFEALTGVLPFEGAPATILWAKEQHPVPSPRALAPGTPAAFDALVTALIDPDPTARAGGDAIRAALAGRAPTVARRATSRPADVFVGRERELQTLADWLACLALDRPFVGHIVGPSGMGKTALLAHFRERAGPALVLASRCSPQEVVPYRALDGAVEELGVHVRRAGVRVSDVAALRALFPALDTVRSAESTPADPTPSPEELRRRGFAAFRSLIAAISTQQPVVLCIDDAHWGDGDSALALVEALRGPDAPRVLLVLAYRGDEAEGSTLLRELERGERTPDAILELAPLDTPDGHALTAHVLGCDPAEPVVERVVQQTGGSPFFIEQLGRYLVERTEQREAVDVAEAILGRIDAFGPGARELAEVVAIGGGSLDVAELLALSATPDSAPLAYRMRAQRMLGTVTSRPRSLEVYHDRIRETVLARIPAGCRRDLHRGVADRLRARPSADPEALLDHLLGAGDEPGATEAALCAADRAASALAFGRAAELFALGRRLRARGDLDWPLAVREADAQSNAGTGRAAGRAYEEAADAASRSGAPPATVLALRAAAARVTLCAGDFPEGVCALRRMLGASSLPYPRTPLAAVARLLLARAQIALRGFDFVSRPEQELPPDVLARVDACWAATVGLNAFDAVRSAAFQARHTLLALDAGEPVRVVRALAAEGVYRAAEGGRAGRSRAGHLAARADALAARTGDPRAIAFARLCAGVAAYFTADWEHAIERLTDAERVFRTLHGVPWELTNCRNYRIWSLAWLGRTATLTAEVGEAAAEARARGDVFAEVVAASGPGSLVWLVADRPDEARVRADTVIARFPPGSFQSPHYANFIAQVRIDLYRGAGGAAWRRLCETVPRLRRIQILRLQLFRIEVDFLTASSALAAAGAPTRDARFTTDELLGAARRAIARLHAEELPVAPALSGLLEPVLSALLRRESVAHDRLLRAADVVERHGLALHAAAARHQAARLNGAHNDGLRRLGVVAPARLAGMLVPVAGVERASESAERFLPALEETLVRT